MFRMNPRSKVSRLPFAADAERLLADARHESDRLRHAYVGTEHVVLAMAHGRTLDRFDIDTSAVCDMIETTVSPGRDRNEARARLPYTARTQQALTLAAERARSCGEQSVSLDSVLIGILDEQKNIGAQVLGHFGLTVDRVANPTK